MLQIRCTTKVQKELGIKKSELEEAIHSDSLLGNWYLNLFTVDRRKTFIFVNEKTLLSFVIFGIKKSNVKKAPEMLIRGLDQLLTIEGIESSKIDKVLEGYSSYQLTKTTSKSVIGNMNDLVALYKHSVLYDGGFKNTEVGKIILQINRTPQKNLGWSNSIELVKELLGENSQKIT